MSNLEKHRKEIQQIIDMISDTYKISCAIYDSNAELFLYTESYQQYFGRGIYKPPIYNALAKDLVVNTQPGESELCVGCIFHQDCPAVFEVSKCFYHHKIPMGILFFSSFSKTKSAKSEHNIRFYKELSTHFAKLIEIIIENGNGSDEPAQFYPYLKSALSLSSKPCLAINHSGTILALNEGCRDLFSTYQISTQESFFEYLPDQVKRGVMNGKKVNGFCFTFDDLAFCLDCRPIASDSGILGAVLKLSITELEEERETGKPSAKQLPASGLFSVEDIKGDSNAIQQLRKKILKIADSPSTVFITGETGTGKGLIAKALHYESSRRDQPFVTVNCSSIPESLFESELFGYEEGAFTGAKKEGKPGKFELAHGGTLFLDEISEIPLNIQVKLLTVLQERTLDRVGGTQPVRVDVRIISATNRDLHQMVEDGRFRSDLLYRLNILPLWVPPLRSRKEDIDTLCARFLNQYNRTLRRKSMGFDNKVLDQFQSYEWPGNIRQLQNVIEYCVNLDEDGVITLDDLPEDLMLCRGSAAPTPTLEIYSSQNITRELLTNLLDRYGWGVQGKNMVARSLNISLRTLYRKLKELHIEKQ